MTSPHSKANTPEGRDISLPELTPAELERYDRQIGAGVLSIEGQRRLKAATALITRVGGMGGPASVIDVDDGWVSLRYHPYVSAHFCRAVAVESRLYLLLETAQHQPLAAASLSAATRVWQRTEANSQRTRTRSRDGCPRFRAAVPVSVSVLSDMQAMKLRVRIQGWPPIIVEPDTVLSLVLESLAKQG